MSKTVRIPQMQTRWSKDHPQRLADSQKVKVLEAQGSSSKISGFPKTWEYMYAAHKKLFGWFNKIKFLEMKITPKSVNNDHDWCIYG